MFLNINGWLPVSGQLLLTTPNGSQFSNPFRRVSPTPHYRSNVYERHCYLYTLSGLTDLIALCGFRIVEAGYWDVYDWTGLSRAYGWLSRLPGSYFKEKFVKSIFVVAEKEEDVATLERCPIVYDARGVWEFVGKNG
ncbi:MAG: hypothetical protein IH968_11205 [Gemmatimonadetes bacterium]|nr:hypothetical protein [Gemmatimonadota bacterium]